MVPSFRRDYRYRRIGVAWQYRGQLELSAAWFDLKSQENRRMTDVAEQKEMATKEPDHQPNRRWWPWLVAGAVIVATIVIVTIVVAPQPEADETTSEGPANTSEVVRTDLIDETVYDGTLGTTEDDSLVAPVPGVISFTPQAGDTIEAGNVAFAIEGEPVVLLTGSTAAYRDFRLAEGTQSVEGRVAGTITEVVPTGSIVEQGDVIARIDGEPIVVLYGDIPMYRTLQDLSENITGPDVTQLEQALTDLGYNEGTVTVDDEFTQSTGDMVQRWQEDLGVEEDGIVTGADVVFIPAAAQVVDASVEVGDRVGDGNPLLNLTRGDALEGPDVEQLEQALSALGFDAEGALIADGVFDAATVAAIEELEASIGATIDGMLAAGEVRFSDTSVRVTDVNAEVGTTVNAGAPVIALSSPDKIVSFDLPAADQGLVAVGDSVTVELPDGEEVPGTVTFVAETATTSVDQLGAVFEIEVALDDPSLAADLEQAPVDVAVVSDSVTNVVAVPVSALVALAEGGYAVEVVQADGSTTLVRVEPGFYAGGLVEIGPGSVEPGVSVIVP